MSAADDVRAALVTLTDPPLRSGVATIRPEHVATLHPEEARHVEGAVAQRRNEFATGRHLLRGLIGTPASIGVSHRRPILPAGFVGSLAHDAELAVAVVAPASAVASVGIDVEPVGQMAPEERVIVARADEQGIDAVLLFVLKEAVYKAWSGQGGRLLEHQDVRVRLAEDDAFVAEVLPEGIGFRGRWTCVAQRWLAVSTPSSTAA